MVTLLILAFSVVILSGVLSMIEASLFSYSLTKARLYASKGETKFKRALEIRQKPAKVIATFVVLSTTISTVGSIVVGTLAARQFSSFGIGVFSAVLTFLAIVFSEVIPKNIGDRWNHKIFPVTAVYLLWVSNALYPFVKILELITKPLAVGVSPFLTSEEEITLLTSEGAKEGSIESHEAEIIRRVFRLNDVTAGDIMTPKPMVDFLNGESTVGEVAEFAKKANHSRFPVYKGEVDNVVGVVHQRDLLRAVANGELDQSVAGYAREALVVSESELGDDLLRIFQSKKTHLAIVVSEYGNVVGVVGLEDVLEELVGEIIDEKDVAPELIKRVSKNEVIVHGQTKVGTFNSFFNADIKSRKTINGFLIDKFGHIPEEGETLAIADLTFKIEVSNGLQIKKVRVTKN